jgi:molybdate/tungstate transport system ATP-binding protein
MITVEKLSIRQGDFELVDIGLELGEGEYGVLMGRSGCGKTTVLEAICGLRGIESGRILLGGQDVTHLPPADRGIGYVPQDGALFPGIKVWEQLAFSMLVRKLPQAEIESRVKELASNLGIKHLLQRFPDGLSGGETQRVALGRALSIKPRFLCMDEPLSALDEDILEEICELFTKTLKKENVTALHITHSKTEASRLGDVVFHLDGGMLKKV